MAPQIETLAWVLPRPRMNPYIKGGFPQHFEKRLLNLYGLTPDDHKILHPFGGKAEYGLRVDVNADLKPDVVADAHQLPFADDSFDMVIVDPPYSDDLSKRIYRTGKLKYTRYVSEAVRVCKPGGYVVLYHVLMLPRPPGTAFDRRILLAIRVWHRARIVGIFKKL